MNITVELSLYPLRDNPVPVIVDFIRGLDTVAGVEIVTNQMSTQIRGDLDSVLRLVDQALRQSFASPYTQVLVAKYINADLPIGTPPGS